MYLSDRAILTDREFLAQLLAEEGGPTTMGPSETMEGQ